MELLHPALFQDVAAIVETVALLLSVLYLGILLFIDTPRTARQSAPRPSFAPLAYARMSRRAL